MRNTFRVGSIIKIENKITAGAMHAIKNPLRLLELFMLFFPFLKMKLRRAESCPPSKNTIYIISEDTIIFKDTIFRCCCYLRFARIWSLEEITLSIHSSSVISPETKEFTGSKNTVRTSTPGIASNAAKLPIAGFTPFS